MRTRSRSTSITPGTLRIAAVAFSCAPSGARSTSVCTVERAMRRPSRAIITATAAAAAASPHQKPKRCEDQAHDHGDTSPCTSEAKCSASAASAWLLVSRAARCSARARQRLTTMSITSTTNGTAEIVGGGGSLAQVAVGLDQDAAGEHVEQGGDAERGDALELAVAVMVLVVGRLVGHPHHRPGDDGRDQVDRGVQRFGDQRQRADRDADHELGRRHAAAGEDRDRRDRCLVVLCRSWRGFSRASREHQATIHRCSR